MFEIRKNLDLRKILFTPKMFLKSRFHCNGFSAETALCPKTLASNLKWLFGSKKVFFSNESALLKH